MVCIHVALSNLISFYTWLLIVKMKIDLKNNQQDVIYRLTARKCMKCDNFDQIEVLL